MQRWPSAPGGTGAAEEFRRLERKFVVDPSRVELVGAWLAHACRPAPDFPLGHVTSCYYDTIDWDSYFESTDGDFAKRKVRLRWYDRLPATGRATAFVEVKEKEGFETWKRRIGLQLDAALLRDGNFEQALPPPALADALAMVGVFESRDLRPAVVISYQRRRFRESFAGVQVSLDSRIEAFAARGAAGWAPVRLASGVLEVKGQAIEMPPPLRGLRRLVPVWSSHSKYALAVDALSRGLGPFRV